MVKYIYQAVALVFIFAGALFLFGRNMETAFAKKCKAYTQIFSTHILVNKPSEENA